MTVTLPHTLTYGYVVGRFLLAVGDTPEDPDSLPDARAAAGSVSFTAATPLTKEFAADPPTTVVRSVISCTVDGEGYLLDPAGNRGVWLVAGVYKVAYSLNTGAITGHDILVLPEHTVENPMDLINYMAPGGPVLSASEYAELSARMETLEIIAAEGGSAVLLGERTLLGTTAETFTGIPNTYRALRLEWWSSRTTNGGATSKVFLNEDTGLSYATNGNEGGQAGITFSSGRLSLGAYGHLMIPDYALSGPNCRVCHGRISGTINAGNANFATALIAGAWVDTAAVTAVTFQPQNSVVGFLRLY